MSENAVPSNEGKQPNERLRGFGKVVFGGLLAAGSIVAYPGFMAAGSSMAAVGASVVGAGMLLDLPKYFSGKKFDSNNTGFIRQFGAAITTAGVATITAPGIGIALATEGVYSIATNKPASVVSSLYKSFNYAAGNNIMHGLTSVCTVAWNLVRSGKMNSAALGNDPAFSLKGNKMYELVSVMGGHDKTAGGPPSSEESKGGYQKVEQPKDAVQSTQGIASKNHPINVDGNVVRNSTVNGTVVTPDPVGGASRKLTEIV